MYFFVDLNDQKWNNNDKKEQITSGMLEKCVRYVRKREKKMYLCFVS